MVSAAPKILTNAWVKASWEEFVALAQPLQQRIAYGSEHQTRLEKAQFYYSDGLMEIEDIPTGFSHGRSQALIAKDYGVAGQQTTVL